MRDVTIGRNPTCNVVLSDAPRFARSFCSFVHLVFSVMLSRSVSRVHCRLFKEGGDVVLEDLSANGTWVDGEKMNNKQQRTLQEGQIILVQKPIKKSSQSSTPFVAV